MPHALGDLVEERLLLEVDLAGLDPGEAGDPARATELGEDRGRGGEELGLDPERAGEGGELGLEAVRRRAVRVERPAELEKERRGLLPGLSGGASRGVDVIAHRHLTP